MSLTHILIIAVFSLMWGIPIARIAWRIGYPKWVAYLALIPGVPILMYLLIAFWRWPIPDAGARRYEGW